jgi:hypothetical protein
MLYIWFKVFVLLDWIFHGSKVVDRLFKNNAIEGFLQYVVVVVKNDLEVGAHINASRGNVINENGCCM